MIRMKIKKSRLKGAIALGLAAALTLGNVSVVRADPITDKAITIDGQQNSSTKTTTGRDAPYSLQGITEGDNLNSEVLVQNYSTYTVSVPKKITLFNVNGAGAGAELTSYINGDKPYIYIKDADVAGGVVMTVSVADVSLTSHYKGATSTYSKKLVSSFANEPTKGSISEGRNWIVNDSDTPIDNNGDASKYQAQLLLSNEVGQTIRAGEWKGNAVFTVSLQNPTSNQWN